MDSLVNHGTQTVYLPWDKLLPVKKYSNHSVGGTGGLALSIPNIVLAWSHHTYGIRVVYRVRQSLD